MASSEHHKPGEPPPIRDEAADTPMWVPAAGLTLLILCAVFLAWQSASEAEEAHHDAMAEEAAEEQGEDAEEAAEADGDEGDQGDEAE